MYKLLTLLACCLLLVAAVPELPEETDTDTDTASFPSIVYDYFTAMPEPTEQEQDVIMAQKINWLPIAQGVDDGQVLARQQRDVEHVEQVDSIQATEQLLESNTRDGNSCPSSAERGLTSLIRNARSLLPLDRLRNIVANAREDAEVRELLKLLRSDQFRERVTRLRNTKEEGVLRDYVCQALKLNHAYYIEYVRLLFDARDPVEPPASSPLPSRRKGVRGLLQDLRDALPRAELRDLYRRQLSADKELSAAVRRLRGAEFRRLLGNVRALPEYRAVRDDLQKAGVPLQQLLNLVANALGWGSLDLGSEAEILSA